MRGAIPAALATASLGWLPSCSENKIPSGPSKRFAPVTSANAPSLAQLKARGLEVAGTNATFYSCGAACEASYTSDVYLGRIRKGRSNEYLFVCPNPGGDAPEDSWKCTDFVTGAPEPQMPEFWIGDK